MQIRKIKNITLALMLVISMTGCTNQANDNDIIATVNGEDITVGYYKKTLDLQKQALESMYGKEVWEQEVEDGVTFEDKFKEDTLKQITNIHAIYDEVEKEKVLPTQEEIDKRIKEVKENIDADENYKKNLENLGIDDNYIKEQQAQDLALQKFKEHFDKETDITDEQAKEYYENNKNDYYIDEVKASHILISTLDENKQPLSEEKKKEAKDKAEDLLKKINEGEDFAELATNNSEDPGSKIKGGDLGYFSKGQMVPEFEEAAYGLKIGEVSDIVESQFGYHIIKLTDKKQEQTPFDKVKDSVKMELKDKKLNEKINSIIDASEIKVNDDKLDEIEL